MMKCIGSIAILVRVIFLIFTLTKFGVDTATACGVFMITIDSMQMRLDIEEIKK